MSLWFDFLIATEQAPNLVLEAIFAGIGLEGIARQSYKTQKFYMQAKGFLATALPLVEALPLPGPCAAATVRVTYHVLEAELSAFTQARIMQSALRYLRHSRQDARLLLHDSELILAQCRGSLIINEQTPYWHPSYREWLSA